MPTIRDVAKAAGVSIATVSAAINGTRYVAEPTRERVLQAVRDLGYQPNRMAKGLKKKKSQMIAHILPSVMNPFFPAALKGLEDAAFAADYSVLVCNTEMDSRRIERYAELLLETQVDGVVITSPGLDSVHRLAARLKERGVPVVVLSGPRSLQGFDRVLVDEVQCGYLATDCLLQYGHELIGFVGVQNSTVSSHRQRGVGEALTARGLQNVAPVIVQATSFTEEEGYRVGLELLKHRPFPSGIVAANDLVALGISEVFHDAGLVMAVDYSLVGIDNTMAASIRPRLASVAIPAYEMGRKAFERVWTRIKQGDHLEPVTIVLQPTLVPGQSVGSQHSLGQKRKQK